MSKEDEEVSGDAGTRSWYYGISWSIAGLVLLLLGFATMGGGYGLTGLSVPFFIASLAVGSNTTRSISVLLLILALSSTWSLYKAESELWLRSDSPSVDGGK